MNIFETIQRRKTTNTAFIDKPVSEEHILQLIKMASCAPSHFNSQPWKFVIITDKLIINKIGKIAGDAMVQLLEDGRFWKQYCKYFRFSEEEIAKTKDGIFIDHVPMMLKPFIRTVMSETGGKVLAKLKVPKILGKDEEELVGGSPLLFAIMLSKEEYKKEELSGVYSLISMGAVIQNLWLSTTAMGMGMQFVSTPCEIPEMWKEISAIINIPDEYEMLAIFRMGYVKEDMKRPTIDWKSSQRKTIPELAFKNKWGNSIID